MPVEINYSQKTQNKINANLVFFSDHKLDIKPIRKNFSSFEFDYINDLIKTADLKKNIFIYEINSKKKIFIISIKKDLKISDIENLGAEFYNQIKKNSEYLINSDSINNADKNFLGHFLHGIKLKSYEFKKYKSKKDSKIILLKVIGNKKPFQLYQDAPKGFY